MTQPNIAQLLQVARKAALEAGAAILEIYATGNITAEEKADHSPLTLADKAAHKIIAEHLQQTGLPVLSEEGRLTPYEERKSWTWYWLVDPLDGTREFLKRNGEFTVNIALMQRQTPVAGVIYVPVTDVLYAGAEAPGVTKVHAGQITKLPPAPERKTIAALKNKEKVRVVASRSHLTPETVAFIKQFKRAETINMGSSLKMMLLAEEKADIYPRFGPTMEWDTAAAHAILLALNRNIYQPNLQQPLYYNKPDLLNPSFIAF